MHVYFAIQEACRSTLPFREETPEAGAKKKKCLSDFLARTYYLIMNKLLSW